MYALWADQWIIYMKNRFFNAVPAFVAAVLVAGCSGVIDEEDSQKTLVLNTDVREIIADGESEVKFTVLYGDEDVTGEASVKCMTNNVSVQGNSFSVMEVGTLVFKAFYGKAVSEEVEVVAKSKFCRRVCVMEFTGAWCAQCPAGATTLNYLISRTYEGQAYAMAFHNDDAYTIPVEKELRKIFNIDAFPAYLTDMRNVGQLNGGGCGDSIEESLYESETHCSVSVACAYDEASGKVTVESKICSEKKMPYRIAAYVIEDRIRGEQKQADGSTDKDYLHRHVVRAMLSSEVRGDELGTIDGGSEASKTYSFAPDSQWDMENLSVVVLAIGEDGQVNNMAVCAADGGSMEYEYVN